MADTVLDRLRIIIGGDAAGLEGALDRASARLSSFGSTVAKAAAAIGISLSLKGVADSITGAIDRLDAIGKAAQKAGAPVDEFGKLASAAGKAGVPLDELTLSMEKLGR